MENKNKHGILSPFKDCAIIIDEVHNFIRQIINDGGRSSIVYNWIVNSEDVKLIFLSGTPVINKPAEIALLYNMLRGVLHVYNFTFKSDKNEVEVQKELTDLFYSSNSSVEQIYCKKQQGKIIISFTKNKSNFESVLEDGKVMTVKYNDHSLMDFFDEIFTKLQQSSIPLKDITPNKKQIESLKSLNDLKLGKPFVFDKQINIVFNRKQKLFDIYDNDMVIDLSDNNNFLNYFFDDDFKIHPSKQVLLRRMMMGLTSYRPIDRSSIVFMPEIKDPKINPLYKDYLISNNINVVPCVMSNTQWNAYEVEFVKERLKSLRNLRKKDMYDDSNFDYHIRTRQNCNIIFEDDSFRKFNPDKKEDSDNNLKLKIYDKMKRDGYFNYDEGLKIISPKFYEIMKNIGKFINNLGEPTGKVLYYSDFRKDAGSEAFEQVLLANGYEPYNDESDNIDDLVSSKNKKKRYTFITGEEKQSIRKKNKDAFNHLENLKGEYIQIMIISSAGAEGISLTGVRQVHIMEPFWNFIRIGQVFGRAIRMGSHLDLPEKDRFVEQYIYLSTLPEGDTVEEVFSSLKVLEWPEVQDVPLVENIKMELIENHKSAYKTIQKILSLKKNTGDRTADQVLFDIMEKKHRISEKISNIIKESSTDCIQNTRDNIQLNEKCLRFSSKVLDEMSHFPGITSEELNKIDIKQFISKFQYHIKPDIYVISAYDGVNTIYIYFKVDEKYKEIDTRYIRENGIELGYYDPSKELFFIYETKSHMMNKKLGSKFSVFQSVYTTPFKNRQEIQEFRFPKLDDITKKDNLFAYIIKYNVSERFFISPPSQTHHS